MTRKNRAHLALGISVMKRYLIASMLILGSLGMVALGSVFMGSMSPSDKARAER